MIRKQLKRVAEPIGIGMKAGYLVYFGLIGGWLLFCLLIQGLGSPDIAYSRSQDISRYFDFEDFEKTFEGGYAITLVNKSKYSFDDFKLIVIGKDITNVTVYRHEVWVDLMEGRSEKTFMLPGDEDEIIDVEIEVRDPSPY